MEMTLLSHRTALFLSSLTLFLSASARKRKTNRRENSPNSSGSAFLNRVSLQLKDDRVYFSVNPLIENRFIRLNSDDQRWKSPPRLSPLRRLIEQLTSRSTAAEYAKVWERKSWLIRKRFLCSATDCRWSIIIESASSALSTSSIINHLVVALRYARLGDILLALESSWSSLSSSPLRIGKSQSHARIRNEIRLGLLAQTSRSSRSEGGGEKSGWTISLSWITQSNAAR